MELLVWNDMGVGDNDHIFILGWSIPERERERARERDNLYKKKKKL